MWFSAPRAFSGRRVRGFTLVELVIVVAIVGLLASIAIPRMLRFQLRTKTSEAKTNLSAVRVVEESYFTENGQYVAAAPLPVAIPGQVASAFAAAGTNFERLGWAPEGRVYFSYGITVTGSGAGFTADAGGDIDGDAVPQFWGYAKPDGTGAVPVSAVGCDETLLPDMLVSPCGPTSGSSIF